MSRHDVGDSARAWLEAMTESEKSEDAFRARTGTFERMVEASRVEKELRLVHLAAVKDLSCEGVPDDERISRLRTEHERSLEKVRSLKHQLTEARENNEKRNRDLDVLHYVWCDGGCQGGVHRYCGSPEDVTEEVVLAAEKWVGRLRRWYVNRQIKKSR
jgi:hypothetical protein